MTKRIIAVWFCRILAIVGLVSALFQLSPLLLRLWGVQSLSNPSGVLSLAFYFFVWLFAQGIGTELAAEGEYGDPIADVRELNTLTWRFAGFLLLFNGALSVGYAGLNYAIYYGTWSATSRIPNYFYLLLPSAVSSMLQAILGFILAFGPRIRQIFR